MRMRSWLIAASVTFAALIVPLSSDAFVAWSDKGDVPWSGPGYYVTKAPSGVDAGPFSGEADCKAAIAANAPEPDARYVYFCDYFSIAESFEFANGH